MPARCACSTPTVSKKSITASASVVKRDPTFERSRSPVAGHVPCHHAMCRRQGRQLRLPREAATAEAVQQHQGRSIPRLAPGEDLAVNVCRRRHLASLPWSSPFVNGVDIRLGLAPEWLGMTVDRNELVSRVRAMAPGARRASRALRPRGELSVRELRRLPSPRPAGHVCAGAIRRARRLVRRLRPRQRGDRSVLRGNRTDVQHAQRDDVVVW